MLVEAILLESVGKLSDAGGSGFDEGKTALFRQLEATPGIVRRE